MSLIVGYTEENLKEITETNINVYNLSYIKKNVIVPVSNVDFVMPVCNNFTDKAVKFMSEYIKNNLETVYSRVITTNGEDLCYVFIKNNIASGFMFEIFKKIGVPIGEIEIYFKPDFSKIYMPGRIYKLLESHNEKTIRTIILYLMSMCHLIKEVALLEKENILSIQTLTSNLCINGAGIELFILDTGMFLKDGALNIELKKGFSEDIRVIHRHEKKQSHIKMGQFIPENIKYLIGQFEGEQPILFLQIPLMKNKYIMLNKTTAHTDVPLTYMDLNNSSIYSTVASATFESLNYNSLPNSNDILSIEHKKSKFKMIDVPSEENDFSENIDFRKCMHIANTFKATQTENIKSFEEDLELKISKADSFVDCSMVKEEYVTDKYAQELYKQIMPYYDNFDLKELSSNVMGFINGAVYSMMFIGESGTGKSTAARVLPYKCGIPYISVNFSVNIEESDLFGTMIPNVEKSKPEDPEFVWKDGIITTAVKNGYCAILEEINFARPGVLGKLNSLLDENKQLDLPTGEIIKAHKNFRIIATCNIAYEGTNRFNKALINRFQNCTIFKELSKVETIKIIMERLDYKDKDKIESVYSVMEACNKFSKENNLNIIISMRQMLNMFSQGKYYKNAYDAILRIMLNGAFIEEEEYFNLFKDTILPAFEKKLTFKI